MKAIDWANGIYKTDLNEPADVSVPSIMAYFRYNIGELNNLLGVCYKLDSSTLEFIDENGAELSKEAGNIYKYIYLLSYYNRLIRNLTGVGAVNTISTIQSDGGIVRFTERHQLARVYLDLRKSISQDLKNLVNKYKMRNQTALDVTGDDILVSTDNRVRENGELYQRNIV